MNLKNLRKQKNMRQDEVAKAINISQTAYSYYENGKRDPDINTLIELSKLFNTTIDNLIRDNPDKIDYNNIMPYQKELIDLIIQANQAEGAKIEAYTLGLFEGKKEYERKKGAQ